MPMHALPVRTDVAAVYRTYNDRTEPIQIKFEDHFIFTSHVGGVSTQKWEGEVHRNRDWATGSIAFLPGNSELVSITHPEHRRVHSEHKGIAVRLSDSLFVKAAQDHIDYGRIDFRFTDITDKTTQMLTHSLHHICMMEKFSNWPLLIETNALSLTVAVIASLSPKATKAFEQKPYGLDAARKTRVVEFVNTNMHRQISLAEMADVAGMSQFHFTRLFKSETGMSPLAFVAQQRVEATKRALRSSGATLAQVAIDCGYASQSHFATAFKAVTGMTPGAYRKSAATA